MSGRYSLVWSVCRSRERRSARGSEKLLTCRTTRDNAGTLLRITRRVTHLRSIGCFIIADRPSFATTEILRRPDVCRAHTGESCLVIAVGAGNGSRCPSLYAGRKAAISPPVFARQIGRGAHEVYVVSAMTLLTPHDLLEPRTSRLHFIGCVHQRKGHKKSWQTQLPRNCVGPPTC